MSAISPTMRAAVYYRNSDIRIQDVPVPAIGPGEALMRICSSGVCGSDVMEWYRIHKAPLILGHEVAGEIVDVGEGVTNVKPGDRVVVSHHVPCMTCRYCRSGHETVCDTLRKTNFDPGGFCEYVRLPAINVRLGVYPIPDGVSDDEASFTEPLACVLRGQRIAGVGPGKNVLVLGSGISGLLHIATAAALGAGVIVATDVQAFRLESAKRFGAALAVHARDYTPDALRAATGGDLADVVITTTGALPALQQAFASVERGGTILLFAPTDQGVTFPLSINDVFWKNDVTVTTTYAGSPADHFTALDMIRARRVPVGGMVTHRLPLASTQEAFGLVVRGEDSIKVIVRPQE